MNSVRVQKVKQVQKFRQSSEGRSYEHQEQSPKIHEQNEEHARFT